MSVLVNVHELRHSFSHRNLFEGLTFSIYEGEKIALIGQNGAGKSTLMKIVAGLSEPDSGRVSRTRGIKVGYLPQAPEFDPNLTVKDAVYANIEETGDWMAIGAAEEAMSRLGLKSGEHRKMGELSGGWKKKVALAHQLAMSPDLLLMDEPTNHLDVETILWLEDWVRSASIAVVIISHDRSFLQRTARRVIEIDRRNPDGILSVEGGYEEFLQVKEDYIENQISREASLKNVLRREVEWLGRGAKARTTKQKARIDRAGDLKEEVQDLSSKTRTQSVKLEFDAVERLPKKLAELEKVSKAYGDQVLFKNLDLKITPRTRLGLMGRNGIGKSTLIKLIVGIEEPTSGTIERSDRMEASYFEQSRETLDQNLTVLKTVCPSGETVEFQGRKMHVRSYLDRFLFSGGQLDQSVSKLSGGEQARLLLARLMLRPANLLILDEPTNDLDLQTLAILEDCLKDFPGAVILVTHDRAFMGEVCNQILAFPEMITFAEIDQWEKWFKEELKKRANISKNTKPDVKLQSSGKSEKKKLSYKEQIEFEKMEGVIAEKEARIGELEAESLKPEVTTHSVQLSKVITEMATLQAEVDTLYARWAELEEKGGTKA
jgi:ATP-binding cassette subfamily F protein uup